MTGIKKIRLDGNEVGTFLNNFRLKVRRGDALTNKEISQGILNRKYLRSLFPTETPAIARRVRAEDLENTKAGNLGNVIHREEFYRKQRREHSLLDAIKGAGLAIPQKVEITMETVKEIIPYSDHQALSFALGQDHKDLFGSLNSAAIDDLDRQANVNVILTSQLDIQDEFDDDELFPLDADDLRNSYDDMSSDNERFNFIFNELEDETERSALFRALLSEPDKIKFAKIVKEADPDFYQRVVVPWFEGKKV